MVDFKTVLNDFSHLVSGMSSVAGGMRSEIEDNMQSAFHGLISQFGFVKRDEFNILSDRVDVALEEIAILKKKIERLEECSNKIDFTENGLGTKD
jgi:BMFP domain-containing protein YqiC